MNKDHPPRLEENLTYATKYITLDETKIGITSQILFLYSAAAVLACIHIYSHTSVALHYVAASISELPITGEFRDHPIEI